jgi:hypothetical protein
VEGIVVAE